MCENTYEDEDPDAYYCASCIEEKNQIAQDIDAKQKAKPKEVHLSDYQIALQKGQEKNGALFVKASDLGLF